MTQYQTLTNQLSQFDQRLAQYGATLAEILQILNSRAFPTQEQWVKCIVSPITSTIHSEADSIRSHHTEITSSQHTTLLQPLAVQTQAIKDLSLMTQSQNQATTLAHTTIMTTSDQTKTILSSTAADVTFLHQYIDNGLGSHKLLIPSQETHDHPPTPLPASEEQKENLDSPIQELDVEYPAAHNHPRRGDCASCHKYSDDLRQCGHCELLFDDPCILVVQDQVTKEEEYQCISCRRKTNPLTGLDGLTEPSEDEKSHSDAISLKALESTSTTTTLEPTNDPNQKPSTKGLRPKGAATARTIIIRKLPPITRNSIKPLERIPLDPNA